MEDIRTLFQQAARKPDSKKLTSKKRTRQIIESDSDDDCVIYPAKSKINANKLSENKPTADNNNNNNVKISPLDYFNKYPTIEDSSHKNRVTAPPVKKQRTDTDLDCSQNTNALIQDIGELDIDQLDEVTSPVSKIDSPKPILKSETTPKPAPSKHNSSNAGAYFAYMNRSGPANPGSKEIPTGQENCLGGLTFVVTGVLDSLERDEAKDLIVKYGGRVVGSLSKKVTHLVVGLEAGESKMEKARQLNIKQINEDDLLDLIRNRNSFVETKPVSSKKKPKPTVKPGKCFITELKLFQFIVL
eukprot:TRINITY_DN1461_c0_g2_i3.p1 TRINITY_DN1461_c0_g2~~TRINITY_DN1461_c0_g2_i3.p1  ORF type:complete len:301 (-),score=81.47 TRINITY_DN1461_c0_g2_i3:42-944(-)